MMRIFATLILYCAATLPSWAEQPPDDQGTDAKVLAELSWHSGIRKSELVGLLANCEADQNSLYLCAWRDSIVADRAFAKILAQRIQKRPRCRERLEKSVAAWQQRRDDDCARSATRQWGENGPITPTAKLTCIRQATERMTPRLARARGCRFR